MFDELVTPPPSVYHPAPEVIALITEVVAPEPAASTCSPSSTTVDQDAPSPTNSQTTSKTQSPIIPNDVEEDNHDLDVAHMNTIRSLDHPLKNIIGELARPVSTKLQLHEHALFCYYDAFLTAVEPKTYKDALTQSYWIEEIQEELNEFKRLGVWEPVPRPDKFMVITLKWIYKVKLDELGGILKNKARLVARGYCQEEGIDFEESFSLEEVYVSQPDRFVDPDVYKLKKDLYWLKQALRAWYQARPIEKHLHAVKRIFRYLRGTVNRGLWYLKDSSIALIAFADADHAGCQDTHPSTSGSMQFLGDRLMRSQLTDYGIGFNKIPMYCDNKSTIALCCNNVQHSRSKHIDIKFHFYKEHVENGVIELYFVNTKYQLANIFTKALGRERIKFLINKLGMRSFMPETLKQLADEVE
nr:hypothetical protein [Tanacetum cinerariifolium]